MKPSVLSWTLQEVMRSHKICGLKSRGLSSQADTSESYDGGVGLMNEHSQRVIDLVFRHCGACVSLGV